MKLTKEQKEELFIEQRYFLDYIVYAFLAKQPSYYYLKDDLKSEAYLKFVELSDTYDGESSKLTTYLMTYITGHLQHVVRDTCVSEIRERRYLKETGDEEPSYTMEDTFSEIFCDAGLTEKQEYVIRQKFQEDKTSQQIGESIGVTRQAVDNILERALAKISSTYEP